MVMRENTGISLIPLTSIISTRAAPALDIPAASRDPDSVIAEFIGARGLPGLAAAVIVDGAFAYGRVAGFRRRGYPEPIGAADAFHLGSNTKAMTALLAAMLVDEGKLRWDSTIGETLGAFQDIKPAYRALTLEKLLSHQSGIPPSLPFATWIGFYFGDRSPCAQRIRMSQTALRLEPKFAPGSAFLYSNFNYVIAGLIIEKTYGQTWESLMQRRLFEPLGMGDAGFGPPTGPWGHSPKPVNPSGRFSDSPPGLRPAGGVHASLPDIVSYLNIYFDNGRGLGGKTLVSPESMAEIMRPRLGNYGLGWESLVNVEGDRLLTHDGCNTMFYCSMYVLPERRFAAVALTNRGDAAGARAAVELREYLVARFYLQNRR
jgi:D-alanyl-D-alanine carboxypeptidase